MLLIVVTFAPPSCALQQSRWGLSRLAVCVRTLFLTMPKRDHGLDVLAVLRGRAVRPMACIAVPAIR